MQVMQWMDGAGVPHSAQMYKDLLFLAQTSSGTMNAAAIRERLGKAANQSEKNTPSVHNNCHTSFLP